MGTLLALLLSFTPVNDTVKLTVILDNVYLYQDSLRSIKYEIAPKWRTYTSWHFCPKKKVHQIIRAIDTVYISTLDVEISEYSESKNLNPVLKIMNTEPEPARQTPTGSAIQKDIPAPTNKTEATPNSYPSYNTGSKSTRAYKSSPNNTKCSSTQCTGYTKKGNRCSRRTTNCNGRCYQH